MVMVMVRFRVRVRVMLTAQQYQHKDVGDGNYKRMKQKQNSSNVTTERWHRPRKSNTRVVTQQTKSKTEATDLNELPTTTITKARKNKKKTNKQTTEI